MIPILKFLGIWALLLLWLVIGYDGDTGIFSFSSQLGVSFVGLASIGKLTRDIAAAKSVRNASKDNQKDGSI